MEITSLPVLGLALMMCQGVDIGKDGVSLCWTGIPGLLLSATSHLNPKRLFKFGHARLLCVLTDYCYKLFNPNDVESFC